ncbi:hypothetical protein ACTQ54_00155 [Fundicoccus sp. Sow4_H7]|uniref:hypothetical protein n=1 Tax=Fundicoccus sp. Sow4_H7 TaxID=3438784 RepID=UPI003F8FA9A0
MKKQLKALLTVGLVSSLFAGLTIENVNIVNAQDAVPLRAIFLKHPYENNQINCWIEDGRTLQLQLSASCFPN